MTVEGGGSRFKVYRLEGVGCRVQGVHGGDNLRADDTRAGPTAGVLIASGAGARGVEAGRVAVGADRVGAAGVNCDRGAGPVSSSVAPKRVRAHLHTASTTLGPRSG